MPTIPYKNTKGERIPGTTTVLGNIGWKTPGLIWWGYEQGKTGKDLYDKTDADNGTRSHYLLECDIKNIPPDYSKFPPDTDWTPAEKCYQNFLNWKGTVRFELVKAELSLVSEETQTGATIDCLAMILGKLCLFDWKTGKGLTVYADHICQIETYRHIYNENFPDDPITGGMYLARISKEHADYAVYHWDEVPEAWESFLLARKLHDLKKKIEDRI